MIDFYEHPDSLIQVMKGFIKLGGYPYIHIGFSNVNNGVSHEKKQEIIRITEMLDEFKESRGKYDYCYNLLHFLCSFSDYNDFAFDILNSKTPLTWFISTKNGSGLNMFEYSIDRGNIDLAMHMIEKCEISQVLSSFPLEKMTLRNLLNSRHLLDFLKCVSENSEKMEELVIKNKQVASLLRIREGYCGVESKIAAMDRPEGEEDDYVDYNQVSKVLLMSLDW